MPVRTGFFGWGLAKAAPKQQIETQGKPLPQYKVILLNDEDHTYQYVIQMLGRLFGYESERCFQLAKQVDLGGKAIVFTTHKELAELKREQISQFGADARIASSRGSMSAIVEPA